MGGSRTYRVPKRVQQQVVDGLESHRSSGQRIGDADALGIASVLTNGLPVDMSIPEQIVAFFSNDWRFHPKKARVASLYGGESGLLWASRILGSMGSVTAAVEPLTDDDILDLTSFSDEDFKMLLSYGRQDSVPQDFVPAVEAIDEEPVTAGGLDVGRVGDVVVVVVNNDDDDDDGQHRAHAIQQQGNEFPVYDMNDSYYEVYNSDVDDDDSDDGSYETYLAQSALIDAGSFAADAVGGGDGAAPKAEGGR